MVHVEFAHACKDILSPWSAVREVQEDLSSVSLNYGKATHLHWIYEKKL